MTYLESYEMLNRMARAFKIGDNAKTVQSRTASIANNSNLEPNKHAMKVNEIVKDIQRVGSTSSTTTKKIDEVLLLKFLKLQ